MSDWQCSHCFATYKFDEFLALPHTPAVPGEDNPTAPDGHGYHPVCLCGREFHRGKWQLKHNAWGYTVSTVHLELDHSFNDGPPVWYETIIFGLKNELMRRYHTQQEAIAGHRRFVRSLWWRIPFNIIKKAQP